VGWLQDLSLGRLQRKPLLQARGVAERLRVDLPRRGHPINSQAIRHAVDADTLMRLRSRVGCLFPQPQDRAFSALLHLNKATLSRRGLQCLHFFHGASSIGSFHANTRPSSIFVLRKLQSNSVKPPPSVPSVAVLCALCVKNPCPSLP